MIKFTANKKKYFLLITVFFVIVSLISYYIFTQYKKLQFQLSSTRQEVFSTKKQLDTTIKAFLHFKSTDQVKRNDSLESENNKINKTFKLAVDTYENLVQLRENTKKTSSFDEQFSSILILLSERNYSSSSALLIQLKKDIKMKQIEIANAFQIPQNVVTNNTPPSNGSQRQVVETEKGEFMMDIIAADLNSTKVVIDTASDGTCANECPVMALGEYAARSGAFAAINGQYFCPADYPSCSGKKNAFDTLLMNKNKVYFNSDNNVYSTNPAVVFGQGYARFLGQSLQWGRDTGVDGVISNYPLLVTNGEIVFGGGGDAKWSGKGSRSFIGNTGTSVYIGVIYNATVEDAAFVLKKLGVQNALNLDSGGSTALWQNGRYLAGPGRNTPFGILFVRR